MKRKIKIVAVVPAFNEEKRISKVLKDLKKHVSSVVVIDDGSTDNTYKSAQGAKTVVLRHIVNLGQGAALQTGIDYIKKINADIVITFDADGQFDASEIDNIIKPIIKNKADVVLGSRFLGKTYGMPLRKKILLAFAILFTRIYSDLNITDTHNGFRAFNKKAYKTISITQNRMSHASEILQEIKKYNLRFEEVPVTVIYDNYSKFKGQKLTGSINILFDLTLRKLFLG